MGRNNYSVGPTLSTEAAAAFEFQWVSFYCFLEHPRLSSYYARFVCSSFPNKFPIFGKMCHLYVVDYDTPFLHGVFFRKSKQTMLKLRIQMAMLKNGRGCKFQCIFQTSRSTSRSSSTPSTASPTASRRFFEGRRGQDQDISSVPEVTTPRVGAVAITTGKS